MSFEINPVLAGKFDAPDYAAANGIATSGSADDVTAPDSRRYTQFDRTATDAGTATMSFGDVLDMINPLEHIPVVSSIYRAITGETINPVSRVTGDILYGGFLGIGSAVLGGMGAVADTGLVAQTGKDSGGLVISALFGPDDDKNPVQLASANTATPASPASTPAGPKNILLSQSATPTPALAALQIPENTPPQFTSASNTSPAAAQSSGIPSSQPAPVPQVTETASSPGAASGPAASASSATGAGSVPPATPGTIPMLASTGNAPAGKQAFGGVMAPPNTQAQDMAMALAQGAPSMRMGHTIYTNRLVNGPHSMPPMLSSRNAGSPAAGAAGTPAPAYAPPPMLPASYTSSSAAKPAAGTNPLNLDPVAAYASGGLSTTPPGQLSPELMQDMMLKALGQYRSTASGPSNSGAAVNLTN